MVILRGYTPDEAVQLSRRAWDMGITNIEVTLQDTAGIEALQAVVDAAGIGTDDRHVGAGTVTDTALVRTAADVGARYTISPGIDSDVAAASLDADLPHLPGVATPTEIGVAQRLGLDWMKAFPATHLGPAWIRAVRGPYPRIRVVATGGINTSNATEFLSHGAHAVALGSALSHPAQIEALAAMTGDSPR
ncbi:bifunctional 4-hydroxy-2-oxoglutarate aldolase/2-dehydro-3-deoxy-phosphogluconate aldolase [Rhodococcus fascians]|nr:bifunctional 4-hydroxy-2-oxoglutarate aldolase/2-dehydro-3-deoxy-phosphogluconate aldolase [Rhodococcus fascians]